MFKKEERSQRRDCSMVCEWNVEVRGTGGSAGVRMARTVD